ncbi:NmrA-like family protein [Byssothecium circinans]|uniref:NmrA-like family protein n=1 Tax=Byssothecium circinans TaxID=147558 RepID=A0A6A5TWL3_9PLEO|nr:NmrA-like family protein [Byssothecium circinans]
MVKIALAGGSGDVASEIIEALVAAKKHDILILSRRDTPKREALAGVSFVKVDYNDPEQLVKVLQGVHTLLSFCSEQEDPTSPAQKKLIDAAVQAGVKRFAPSEWAASKLDYLDWYAYKGTTREYLKEINKNKKVLEYTLFQPGLALNYLTYPHSSAKHLHLMNIPMDFNSRRFLTVEGGDDSRINLVTVQDLANVVARAVEYEGEWPVVGGIRGTEITMGDLISLAKKIRGGNFDITRLKQSDLESGEYKASWAPVIDHPALKQDQVEAISKHISARILLSFKTGGFAVEDNWNRLLPDYKFTDAEEFLTKAWKGKP